MKIDESTICLKDLEDGQRVFISIGNKTLEITNRDGRFRLGVEFNKQLSLEYDEKFSGEPDKSRLFVDVIP